jgi:signal transduction histidine kinase
VLTTLLMAAAATSNDEMRIATRMASNTIGQLDGAVGVTPGAGDVVDVAALGSRLEAASATIGAPFPVIVSAAGDITVPAGAAEALYAATVQAMVNSVQHAGQRAHRHVLVEGSPHGDAAAEGISVDIVDDGAGFDPADVPPGRLGVRVSIVERISRSGGTASVRSAPGAGTIVSLSWPAKPSRADDTERGTRP